MSGGGGGSGNGGGDMQVSGAEAAYSKEKGISTHADTRVSQTSFSPGGGGEGQIDHADSKGNIVTSNIGTGPGEVDPGLAKGVLGADTSTVGFAKEEYSPQEIEKGYTDEGVKLDQVGAGQYMTKAEQYSTGLIEKDPETGEDVQGRYRINANTGEFERTDMSFADHWKNAPNSIRMSPTLRFLYASGKNIGEWMGKKGFEGYSEAGLKTNKWGFLTGGDSSKYSTDPSTGIIGGGDNESRQMMNELAPDAPYIIAGTTTPQSSVAGNWYKNLGKNNASGHAFSFAKAYSTAKDKQIALLGKPSPVGWLAVNNSPFYNFLKARNLDKGIL